MSPRSKLIRTIYLYLAALISLIFVAVGSGRIVNTTLKAYFFPEAEKGGYSVCNNQPPIYTLEISSLEKTRDGEISTAEQKQQLEALLRDYKEWKENNSGDVCYKRERAMNYVDSFTMFFIALPILIFHWTLIARDRKEENNVN